MHSSVKPKKVQTKIEKETKEVERKRQRSRLSESEKEALALAEAIESGCSLPAMSTLSPSDSFWCDQLPHSDAERMWQESLSGQVKVDKNTSKPDQFRRDDRPPPDSGFHGSQPPSLPRNGGEGQFPSSGAERFDSELPSGPPNWSDESTYLAPDTEVTAIHKDELLELNDLREHLQQVENHLLEMNSEQLDDLEPRLLDAESQIRSLVDDPEADMLLATVAGLRTRHVTLESQAKRYKQKIQDAVKDQSQRDEELQSYQSLLNDLDHWVGSARNKLKTELPKFTSIKAVLIEMDSSKDLEKDMVA